MCACAQEEKESAEKAFKDIGEAYSVLSDPQVPQPETRNPQPETRNRVLSDPTSRSTPAPWAVRVRRQLD